MLLLCEGAGVYGCGMAPQLGVCGVCEKNDAHFRFGRPTVQGFSQKTETALSIIISCRKWVGCMKISPPEWRKELYT